jgi:hypothetical protein
MAYRAWLEIQLRSLMHHISCFWCPRIPTTSHWIRASLAQQGFSFELAFSDCLLIPFSLRVPFRFFESQGELATGWTCLQPQSDSYIVCVMLSLPRLLPELPHKLFPPPALQTSLLPTQYEWSTCFCPFRPPRFPCCPPSHFLGPASPVVVPRCT